MNAKVILLSSLFLGVSVLATPSNPPTLLADLNHDGLADERDSAGDIKDSVAYFLPNIGVTGDHCPEREVNGRLLTEIELEQCNDGQTNTIYDPGLFAPLRTLPFDCSDDALGEIHILPYRHSQRVRIFLKTRDGKEGWTYFDPEAGLNATLVRQGVELGIDSRELVTDRAVWDGNISLQFVVTSMNETKSSAPIHMELAPALTTHHLQKVQRIATVNETFGTNIYQPAFVESLDKIRQNLGVSKPLLTLVAGDPEIPQHMVPGGYHDAWTQDIYEEVHASIPAPNNTIKSVRIYLRSPQSTRGIGRQVFTSMRGSGGTGAWFPYGFGRMEVNGYGNMETIPPHKDYKMGRVLLTKHRDLSPEAHLVDFVRAQGKDGGLQDPLIIEGGFMLAGHIDEFVSFIPNNETTYGWSLLIPDVDVALEALEKASDEGKGNTPAFREEWNYDSPSPITTNLTIDELLEHPAFQWAQNHARKHLTEALETLKRETGIEDSDVIRVPVLYDGIDQANVYPFAVERKQDGMEPPRVSTKPGQLKLASLYPSALNSLIVGNDVVCAKQWGPMVDGRDILEEAVDKAFGSVGNVHYIDTLMAHHVFGGEVHCATNTLREALPWW